MQPAMKMSSLALAGLLGAALLPAGVADAREPGRGGGARATAKSSVNPPAAGARTGQAANRSTQASRNQTINRNTNVSSSRNTNINVDRDVHIEVDDNRGWNDWDDHPVATAAAVTAGVALTSAVIGSIVYSVPPSCVTTVVNGMAYQQCGSTWYEPRYSGTTVQYVVVNPPG